MHNPWLSSRRDLCGRAHNIHLATQPNFRKPGDISSISCYFRRDTVLERLETESGLVPVPPGPGIGSTTRIWPRC